MSEPRSESGSEPATESGSIIGEVSPRGGVVITIDGKAIEARLEFDALESIELRLGRGLPALYRSAFYGELAVREIVTIAHALVERAGGKASRDEVGRALHAAGAENHVRPAQRLLQAMLNGGVPKNAAAPTGEAKTTPATADSPGGAT